jgi:hypothetical protein
LNIKVLFIARIQKLVTCLTLRAVVIFKRLVFLTITNIIVFSDEQDLNRLFEEELNKMIQQSNLLLSNIIDNICCKLFPLLFDCIFDGSEIDFMESLLKLFHSNIFFRDSEDCFKTFLVQKELKRFSFEQLENLSVSIRKFSFEKILRVYSQLFLFFFDSVLSFKNRSIHKMAEKDSTNEVLQVTISQYISEIDVFQQTINDLQSKFVSSESVYTKNVRFFNIFLLT